MRGTTNVTSTPDPAPREDNGLGLLQLLREDWETHDRSLSLPGLHALALHRLVVWAQANPEPLGTLARLLYGVLNRLLVRNVYGLEISRTTVIGRRLRIGHHQGVILGNGVVLGDDCLLRQNVTLGLARDDDDVSASPRVGNRVQFGAGAVVVGSVTIGDGARIGPLAVVTRDVAPGATVRAAAVRATDSSPAPGEAG
jgi:serine O-acetyltransferase